MKAWFEKRGVSYGTTMTVLAVSYGLIQLLFGEKIPVNGGLGWDGTMYARIATLPFSALFQSSLDTYLAGRILTPMTANAILKLTKTPPTNENLVALFGAINAVFIWLSVPFYVGITRALRFPPALAWVGFGGLFFNYLVARSFYYIPVSTDAGGFFFSFVSLWAYITRRRGWLFAATLVGQFAWPTLFFCNAMLILFPYGESKVEALSSRLKNGGAALVVAIGLGSLFYFGYVARFHPPNGETPLVRALLPLSIPAVAAYWFFSIRPLVGWPRLPALPSYFVAFFSGAVALVGLSITRYFGIKLLSNGESDFATSLYFANLHVNAVQRPFVFIIGNAVVFGPLFLLTVLRWKQVVQIGFHAGVGITGFLALHAYAAANPEARQVLYGFPIVAILALQTLAFKQIQKTEVVGFAALTFLFSKIWYPINLEPFSGSFQDFPWQNLMMNSGGYMGTRAYMFQGAAVLCAIGLIARRLSKLPNVTLTPLPSLKVTREKTASPPRSVSGG